MKRALVGCAGLVFAACRPAPEACPPRVSAPAIIQPESSQARALLSDTATRAAAAGAGDLLVAADGVASEGDRVGAFVSLPEGACAIVFARGSKGVADLDLFAFQDDGTPYATDESASAEASLLLCGPHPDRLFFSTRVASGAGRVALGVQPVPPAAAPRVAAAIGAHARGEESGRLESWPGLEAKIAEHRREIGSSWEDVRRFATLLDPRAPTRTTLAIEPGRCLDVLVAPSDEVSSLEVVVEDESARVIARAQTDGRDRTIVLCSEQGDSVTIAARPRGGSGLAAFVLGRSPKGAASEIAETVSIASASPTTTVERARVALAKEIDLGWGKGASGGVGEAKVGSRSSLEVKLGVGCTRLDVIAGKPLSPVSAALWAEDGALISEDGGGLGATLYSCSAAAKGARVDVESLGRPGPFAIETRTWKSSPAELAERPLAGARLLARVLGRAEADPSTLGSLSKLELAAGKLFTSSTVIQPGVCAEVVVASDAAEPAGVELRLVDESAREDVLGRGRFVASQRLCANRSARKIRVEARTSGPTTAALLLVRSLAADAKP